MNETNDDVQDGTGTDRGEVIRKVQTPLDDIAYDAALAANMNPNESDVVDAGVTADGELELKLEGERL